MPRRKRSIIDDSTDNDRLYPKDFGRGLEPEQRDAEEGKFLPVMSLNAAQTHILMPRPRGADPAEVRIFDESEWDALYDEQQKTKSSLKHIRLRGLKGKPIPSLDQNGQGYCWMYSSGTSMTLARAAANVPYVRLSPHACAWKVKGGRDEGGWTGQAAPFVEENGMPSVEFWAEKSMNGRQYDTPATWENAKHHRPAETWIDMRAAMYDRNLARKVIATLLFLNCPCTADFDEWSHSVGVIEWTRIERGSWGPTIWNSWADGWEELGMSVIRKWDIDGSVCYRTPYASAI